MTPLFGHTRSVVRSHYALLEPSGFVASPLPEWQNVRAYVVISPAMGARFAQTHLYFDGSGGGSGLTEDEEFCAYVLAGSGSASVDEQKAKLRAGSFVHVAPATHWKIRMNPRSEVVLFSKHYEALGGIAPPGSRIGHESEVEAQPFLGDPNARLQVLLPDMPEFDMAVNIFTFDPGATLPMVETHIMEHGLLMLKGQGVYRLDQDYHPVKAGDVIWMASYCPQWFVAMGKTPASYIYYKDVNRDPM